MADTLATEIRGGYIRASVRVEVEWGDKDG